MWTMPFEGHPLYAQAKLGILGSYLPENPGQTVSMVPGVSSLPVHPDWLIQMAPIIPAIPPTPPDDFQRPTASLDRPSGIPTSTPVGLLASGIGPEVQTSSPTNRSAESGPQRKCRLDWCHWPVCQEFYRTGKCKVFEKGGSMGTKVPVGEDKGGVTTKTDAKQRGGGGEVKSEINNMEVASEDRGVSKCQVKGDEGEGVTECMAAHIKPGRRILLTRDGDVRVCFDSMGLTQSSCERKNCHFYHPTKAIRAEIVAKRHARYLTEREKDLKDKLLSEEEIGWAHSFSTTSSGLPADEQGTSVKQPRLFQIQPVAPNPSQIPSLWSVQNISQGNMTTSTLPPNLIHPSAFTQHLPYHQPAAMYETIPAPNPLQTLDPAFQSTPMFFYQPTAPTGLESLAYNQEISNYLALLQQNQILLGTLLPTANQQSFMPLPAYQQQSLGLMGNSVPALNGLFIPSSNNLIITTVTASEGVQAYPLVGRFM